MTNISYNENLLKLLNNEEIIALNDELLLNIYLTLLSLNNHNYNELLYTKEIEIVELFLRKVNNLKVKLQLKRKELEIEQLHDEIKEIYKQNTTLIEEYNLNKTPILKTINSKDPSKITKLIDNLTKEKNRRINLKEKYDKLRNDIINKIFKEEYYLNKDILYVNQNSIIIPLNDFYIIFSYLLNIGNYKDIYINELTNKHHNKLINNIINLIIKRKIPDDSTIIPIILIHLLKQEIPNYKEINTSKFNIDNIKITDLYSFANSSNNNPTSAKWKNISIPNEYLYNKINEITIKGMYYYENDKFIFENINNNISDFKISINIQDMKDFLSQNLLNIINQPPKVD